MKTSFSSVSSKPYNATIFWSVFINLTANYTSWSLGQDVGRFHAARVLPGYEPDNKIKSLQELKEQVEVALINASNIEHSKAS